MTNTVETIEVLIEGWFFGILTAILYATVTGHVHTVCRNRLHRKLLDAGISPLDIMKMEDSNG